MFVSGFCFLTGVSVFSAFSEEGDFFWLGGWYLGGLMVSGVGNFWKKNSIYTKYCYFSYISLNKIKFDILTTILISIKIKHCWNYEIKKIKCQW